MAFKKITVFLVPDGTNRVKQFKFPRFLLPFLSLLFISCSAFFVWTARDYLDIKAQTPRLAQLEKDSAQKKVQITHLSQRIAKISQKMAKLNEFDHKLKVMVNLEKNGVKEQFWGIGGSDPSLFDAKYTMAKGHRESVREMHRSLDDLDDEIALGIQHKAELYKFLENQKILLASTPSIWPAKGWLSSRFGYRISPFTGLKEFHKGIDIATRMGAPIIAPADGIVSYSGRDRGYGKVLIINHGHGLMTKYAHLKKAFVKKGKNINRGDKIALVGNTGRSTGPHLHYEVRVNKIPVNPLHYILN